MSIAVVLPTFERPIELERCLAALRRQVRPADQIVVVVRDTDDATRAVLSDHPEVEQVEVREPGVLAAMVAGSLATHTTVIAFTDDDAEPHPDWLARIEAAFEQDASLWGVGGRDQLFEPDRTPRPTELHDEVGIVSRMGRLTGNHHCGTGPPRRVDVLKGVCAAYRADALALPTGLRGAGAQVHFEVAIGLSIEKRGGTLLYDPAILVDHTPGVRRDLDARDAAPPSATRDASYNLSMAIGVAGPWRFALRILYALLVGDGAQPGLVRAGVARLRGEQVTARRLRPAMLGTLDALRSYLRGVRVGFVQLPPR